MRRHTLPPLALAALGFLWSLDVTGQVITRPPSGDNQKASVSQFLGLVEVNVTYSSPKVISPTGEDRTGKIWGQLVPYGMSKDSFGTCGDQCPWRAGANENTVFRVSHDVRVEGQPLPAGAYGLHMVAGETEWTVIFSKNSTSWGSFFYDAKEDALRVKVKPKKNEYTHWLTYDFVERQPAKATLALKWENLQVPITITVDNLNDLYVENMRKQLRSEPGFTWESWEAAAQFCLQKKTNLAEGLKWAQNAVSLPYIGQENFRSLSTLSELQAANGLDVDSKITIRKALEHPTASPIDLHGYGRMLLKQGKKQEALEIFQLNAKKNPNVWPVNVGLARGYSAVGKTKEALASAKAALAQAPDDENKKSLTKMVELLSAGKSLE